MQVMQSTELDKTEVLVGQAAPTQNFGVSDDPMLMSMLSTGFYNNPLRTMIQEIMFNAWDAHRMGECLDKPIDIYINEGSGLIIRDYGPGIPDEDIHPTYCIYGGSTKRKDKRQTGGFGLGSKSPFAYTESFTVTSMNQHVKCMYLISRVSEDGGKPGLTRLMKIDTTETGLMVTVPLVPKDRRIARDYVYNLLFLSGIKANVHYMDEPVNLVESVHLKPGEYHIADNSYGASGLYAVYGGVRYSIPSHDEYLDEWNFLNNINRDGRLYIGFAPDTLTPLPNREGLNMSQKCRDAVKTGFEVCIERFKEILTPLIHAYFRANFEYLVNAEVQPQFALYRSTSYNHDSDIGTLDFIQKMANLVPINADPSMWKVSLSFLYRNRKALVKAIGVKQWNTIRVQQFINAYPNEKQMAFASLKDESVSASEIQKTIASVINPRIFKDLFAFEQKMAAEFPDDDTLHPTLRYQTNTSTFTRIGREKTRKSWSNGKVQVAVSTFKDPAHVYDTKSLDEIHQLFLEKTILIAKTNHTLGLACPSTKTYFSKLYLEENKYYDAVGYGGESSPLLGYVIHNRKGAYQKAKEILISMGYKVLEAPEPERATRVPGTPAVKQVPAWPTLKYVSRSNWTDGTQIEDPTHFLYITQSTINSEQYYERKQKPSYGLMELVLKTYPKTVLIQNTKQAEAMKEKGLKTFESAIEEIYTSMETKKYRYRNIIRAIRIMDGSHLSLEMIQNSIIQKTMGMVPIKEDDLSFWDEVKRLRTIANSEYVGISETAKKATIGIKNAFIRDPLAEKIQKNIEATKLFYEANLQSRWKGKKPEDRDEFAKLISHFILGS